MSDHEHGHKEHEHGHKEHDHAHGADCCHDDHGHGHGHGHSEPEVVYVEVEIAPEHIAKFLEVMKEDVKGSRAEPGCLRFDLLKDKAKDNVFYFYEAYKDAAAMDFHKTQPHYLLWADFKKIEGSVIKQVRSIPVGARHAARAHLFFPHAHHLLCTHTCCRCADGVEVQGRHLPVAAGRPPSGWHARHGQHRDP